MFLTGAKSISKRSTYFATDPLCLCAISLSVGPPSLAQLNCFKITAYKSRHPMNGSWELVTGLGNWSTVTNSRLDPPYTLKPPTSCPFPAPHTHVKIMLSSKQPPIRVLNRKNRHLHPFSSNFSSFAQPHRRFSSLKSISFPLADTSPHLQVKDCAPNGKLPDAIPVPNPF